IISTSTVSAVTKSRFEEGGVLDSKRIGDLADLTAAAVWGHVTRHLTGGDNIVLTKGTGILGLNDIAAGAAMTLDPAQRVKLAALQPDYAPSKAGDEMALTAGAIELQAIANEGHLINEADGQTIVNAIVGAIGNTNLDQTALVAAFRADFERNGGMLYLVKAKTDNLPASPAAVGSPMNLANDAITAAVLAASAISEIQSGLFLADDYAQGATAEEVAAAADAVIAALPADYQQRNEPVTLPNPAPAGYGGSGGGGGGSGDGFTDEDRERLSSIDSKTIAGQVTVQSPVSAEGEAIELVMGDAYLAADGRALEWAADKWPVLTDRLIRFRIEPGVTVAGEITAPKAVRVELLPSHTASLRPVNRRWKVEATLPDGTLPITLAFGELTLKSFV
ncbi:MAG: hypothetical protein V4710_15590, partial [Verrucomicrobiota bacterium]